MHVFDKIASKRARATCFKVSMRSLPFLVMVDRAKDGIRQNKGSYSNLMSDRRENLIPKKRIV